MNANGALKHVGVRLTAEVNFQQKCVEKYRSIYMYIYHVYINNIYIMVKKNIRKSCVYNVNMFIYVSSLSYTVISMYQYVSNM